MSTPEDEWEEFINTVVANVRQHAGYFSWESDRSIEEVGVVQSLSELHPRPLPPANAIRAFEAAARHLNL